MTQSGETGLPRLDAEQARALAVVALVVAGAGFGESFWPSFGGAEPPA